MTGTYEQTLSFAELPRLLDRNGGQNEQKDAYHLFFKLHPFILNMFGDTQAVKDSEDEMSCRNREFCAICTNVEVGYFFIYGNRCPDPNVLG